jgi:hypothetical protein
MCPMAIGYRRRPSIPATDPFFDFIDEEPKPVILAIFERTANDEPILRQVVDALMSVAGDRRAPVILRSLLDGPIRAVPCQQFGTDKVVLRADFEVTHDQLHLPRACSGHKCSVRSVGTP